jgi:hypothetical protein
MPSSLGFPLTPTVGQEYVISGKTYVWDGTVWNSISTGGATLTQEEVQDYAAPLLAHSGHTNITATYNDVTNKVILNSQGGSGGPTDIGLLIALS